MKSARNWQRTPISSQKCGGIFDVDSRRTRLAELSARREEPGFWDDHKTSGEVSQEISSLSGVVDAFDDATQSLEDLNGLWEIYQEEAIEEGSSEYLELVEELRGLTRKLDRLEIESLLDGEYDNQPAIVTIQAGAGGVDSADFAEMLFRMYSMWARAERLEIEVLDERRAEEAGVQMINFRVSGRHAFGYMKVENGVHRLVRISPFDNAHKRHTSFANVGVIPEIPANLEVEINEDDIRMDVFRSSGAGGQHVNKTNSAVRLTHMPTGIVVSCQNQRSQHQNRDVAMLQLKSKLVALMLELHKERVEDLRGVQSDIAWGNQIRNYVLHPYQMIKDLRTGMETSNTQKTLDGDLSEFIWAGLRWMRKQRGDAPG
ncbi:MAG: peptide chain release factor 2 [bacterium]